MIYCVHVYNIGLKENFLAEFSYGKISGEFFLADIAQSLMEKFDTV